MTGDVPVQELAQRYGRALILRVQRRMGWWMMDMGRAPYIRVVLSCRRF